MRKCVLIVEDIPEIALVLRMILEPAGYAVHWAEDLLTARTILAGSPPPDLVLLDRILPDGDGLDLCREVKANGRALPVVVLTAYVDGTREQSLGVGADGFITKPFDPDELVSELQRLLSPDGQGSVSQAA
jgi:two-component system, OmpR family, response regulator VicR